MWSGVAKYEDWVWYTAVWHTISLLGAVVGQNFGCFNLKPTWL
jgi:hypothetical protein